MDPVRIPSLGLMVSPKASQKEWGSFRSLYPLRVGKTSGMDFEFELITTGSKNERRADVPHSCRGRPCQLPRTQEVCGGSGSESLDEFVGPVSLSSGVSE
jgi:hypothetical protein